MQVAFWSPMHGTGTTSNMLALAVSAAVRFNSSLLVTQTHYSMNNLESPLLGKKNRVQEECFLDDGMDAAIRSFKAGIMSGETIESHAIRLLPKLSLLTGTRQSSRQTYEEGTRRKIIRHILSIAEDYYSRIYIDTNSGYSPQSFEILEGADVIVISLRQNRDMIEELFQNSCFEGLKSKKLFYVFGDYDAYSKYNLSNMKHLYREFTSQNLAGIPRNSEFMDAISDRKVLNFISEGVESADADEADGFFTQLLKTADKFEKIMKETSN